MLDAQQITRQVDRENAIPILERNFEHAAFRRVRDVVDENIQASIRLFDVIEHGGNLLGLGDVGRKIIAADFLRDLLGIVFMA